MSPVSGIACIGRKRGKCGEGRGWQGLSEGLKNGQLTLSMGPARMGIRDYVQGATIPSKRVDLYYVSNTKTHIILKINIVLVVKYILCVQVKNKPRDGDNGTCIYSWLSGLVRS
jgi:hypothetical protein